MQHSRMCEGAGLRTAVALVVICRHVRCDCVWYGQRNMLDALLAVNVVAPQIFVILVSVCIVVTLVAACFTVGGTNGFPFTIRRRAFRRIACAVAARPSPSALARAVYAGIAVAAWRETAAAGTRVAARRHRAATTCRAAARTGISCFRSAAARVASSEHSRVIAGFSGINRAVAAAATSSGANRPACRGAVGIRLTGKRRTAILAAARNILRVTGARAGIACDTRAALIDGGTRITLFADIIDEISACAASSRTWAFPCSIIHMCAYPGTTLLISRDQNMIPIACCICSIAGTPRISGNTMNLECSTGKTRLRTTRRTPRTRTRCRHVERQALLVELRGGKCIGAIP